MSEVTELEAVGATIELWRQHISAEAIPGNLVILLDKDSAYKVLAFFQNRVAELKAAAKQEAKPNCAECDNLRAENLALRDAKDRILVEAKKAWGCLPPCECERLRAVNKKLLYACHLVVDRFISRTTSEIQRLLRNAIAEAEKGSQADDAR